MLPKVHINFAEPSLSQNPFVYLTDAHDQRTAPKLLRIRLMLTIIVMS